MSAFSSIAATGLTIAGQHTEAREARSNAIHNAAIAGAQAGQIEASKV